VRGGSPFRRLFHLRLWGPDVEQGIDWELAHHVEERTDELVEGGMDESEARHVAEREIAGNVALRAELRRIDRDVRRRARLSSVLGTVWQDIRYGARSLAAQRSFAAAVILTLALGIGANGALFSVADALLLRPLPFAAPEELAQVEQVAPGQERGMRYLAPAVVRRWQADQTVVPSSFLHWRTNVTHTGRPEPASLPALAVGAGFEGTLGVSPTAGRGFQPEDMVPGALPVVLVSHDFRTRVLGDDVVGSTIELNDVPHTVIGVMPAGFKYPLYSTTDVWLPLPDDNRLFGSEVRHVELAVRANGGDFAAAEPAVSSQARGPIREQSPDSEATWRLVSFNESRADISEVRHAMNLLAGAVLLILLIAGVNMVNLLLLRGAARTREIAVRLALGASRGRLVRQLGTEAMLLALLSGVVAVALSFGALRMLQLIMPSSITFWSPFAIALEGRTLLFTFALAVASGFIFGLLPALRATRLAGAAGGLAPHTSAQPAGSAVLLRGLVTAEVALAMTLLIGAGLLLGSFARLMDVEPGIELDRLTVAAFHISERDHPDREARAAYVRDIEARVGALPGVAGATVTGGLPPRAGGLMFGVTLEAEGQAPQALEGILPMTTAGPDFFAVTGARLLAGRPFDAREYADADVAILNRDLAEHLWPGGTAVGQRFRTGEQSPWITVVGVTDEFRLRPPHDTDASYALILPHRAASGHALLAVRATGDPRTLVQPVRAAIQEVNPRQVIESVETASSYYSESVDMQRFLLVVVATLAALALALTAVGLYGLLAYGVARRRREIGVRLALGAQPGHMRRLIVGETLLLTVAGALLGAAGALASSRIIEATLFGVQATDARTWAGAGAVILAAALLAAVLPAERAARIDPAGELRAE
jgi:putative ABC transport system permease protein